MKVVRQRLDSSYLRLQPGASRIRAKSTGVAMRPVYRAMPTTPKPLLPRTKDQCQGEHQEEQHQHDLGYHQSGENPVHAVPGVHDLAGIDQVPITTGQGCEPQILADPGHPLIPLQQGYQRAQGADRIILSIILLAGAQPGRIPQWEPEVEDSFRYAGKITKGPDKKDPLMYEDAVTATASCPQLFRKSNGRLCSLIQILIQRGNNSNEVDFGIEVIHGNTK
jgi:hypothetical protein